MIKTQTDLASANIYLTLDCEFTEQGFVRELVLLLYKNNQIVRALEVLISPSGNSFLKYNPQQINYHLKDPYSLNLCIDGFLKSCLVYTELKNIRIVGMSLESDMKSLRRTTKKPSLLDTLPQKTQLEMCGRGTLETKAKNYGITNQQVQRILTKLIDGKHLVKYKYHTALYDAIVTGYVYLRVTGYKELMGVHNRFKKCKHTYFKKYYEDLLSQPKKALTLSTKESSQVKREAPKNFPDIGFKVQKRISSVFDIVPRAIFYKKLSRMKYEPSIRKSSIIKADIMEKVYLAKESIRKYDTDYLVTDPYNPSLVHAGELLVYKRITPEEFIDFAIYMQQYNLPKNKGTYYKVWNTKKELFVRCLHLDTAKKLLAKRPYCTIEQFLSKEIPECLVEVLEP